MTAAVIGVTAVAGAASAASSKPKAPKQTQTTETPISPLQTQEISHGLLENRRIYEAGQQLDPYSGDTTANQDPRVQQALDGGAAYAAGPGGALAGQATNAAGQMIGATPGYLDRATQMATNGAGPMNATAEGVLTAAATGQPLAQTGATGVAGQQNVASGVQNAQGLVQRAQGDPAQAALTTGGQFANSDVVQGQIDAAAGDISRNFNEVTAPGLNARASAGGNLNSARAGVAEAVARRDAGTQIANASAALRANAFSQGVDASMTGNAQNNTLALGANNQVLSGGAQQAALGEETRQFDAGTALQGATTLGAQDIQNRALNAQTQLAANEQTGEAAFRGFDAAQSAGALVDANTGRQVMAGQNAQVVAQDQINDNMDAYYRDYNFQRGLLNDFMGPAGGNYSHLGSTTTTVGPTPQSPSIIQGALGGAMMGAGASPYFRNTGSVGGTRKSTG